MAISIGAFFGVFELFSTWVFMTTYGELQHTYNRLQSYTILFFFTSAYVLIDNGLQTASAEIRFFTERRKELFERQRLRALRKDRTLEKRRYTNYKRKTSLCTINNFLDTGFAFSGD